MHEAVEATDCARQSPRARTARPRWLPLRLYQGRGRVHPRSGERCSQQENIARSERVGNTHDEVQFDPLRSRLSDIRIARLSELEPAPRLPRRWAL